VCKTENVSANLSKYAQGCTPLEIITGETPDISEYLDFEFYDWALFRSNAGLGEVELARWLGVSHRVGRLMSYWVLQESGIPISAITVQRLTNDERNTVEMQQRMNQYDEKLKRVYEAQSADISNRLRNVDSSKIIDPENEDPDFFEDFMRVIDNATLKHADTNDVDVTSDPYVGMELAMTRGGEGKMMHAREKADCMTMKDDQLVMRIVTPSSIRASTRLSTLTDRWWS
jgi:hypothetical protein